MGKQAIRELFESYHRTVAGDDLNEDQEQAFGQSNRPTELIDRFPFSEYFNDACKDRMSV